MAQSVAIFLLQAAGISLSGVLAPGPVTAATLAAGSRNRHAGAWIAVGHGIVEFPLMVLIMAGAGAVLTAKAFRIGVGLAGGGVLLLMAGLLLRGMRRKDSRETPSGVANPVWAGIALTAGNPYFLLWWATAGLALATRAMDLGVLAFGLFAVVHWVCDLMWLEILSLASHRGVSLLGRRSRQALVVLCSAAMAAFGGMFLLDAVRSL